jgi:nucleotide-binding universal stress UspA family protein
VSHQTNESTTAPPTRGGESQSAGVVLLALDGSAAAATALPVASSLARRLGAPLHILYVAQSAAEVADFAALAHRDTTLAPAAEIEVRVGDPASEILRAIEEPRTYLTILTTHGREIEPGRHLGHVAEAVIARTMRPILLIRPEAAALASTAIEARHFLVPLDGAAATARALSDIFEIVHRLSGSCDVLFVADPLQVTMPGAAEPGSLGIPHYIDQPHHEWPAWMREVQHHLSASAERYPLDVPAHVHVAAGTISSVVLQFVAEHHEDVIVLVRRSRLEAGHAQVLRTLLDKTPCPVLLTGAAEAPEPARAFASETSA